jgi:signal transduction histidine kinase
VLVLSRKGPDSDLSAAFAELGNVTFLDRPVRVSHLVSAVRTAQRARRRQIGHMVRLLDDLLDVARISTGRIVLQRRRGDLAEVVRTAVETARPLLDKMGHRLTVTLPEPPVALDGDPTRLAQVFANLLNNAAKYTDSGGQVRISAAREGGQAVVRVADDGIGIPADRLAGVFEMFHQVEGTAERSHKGLGVGLAVVKGLVELHGGRVEAASDGAPDHACRAAPDHARRAAPDHADADRLRAASDPRAARSYRRRPGAGVLA